MNTSILAYPVLCIPRNFGIGVADSQSKLERCASVFYWHRSPYYEGLRLVDSNNQSYEVINAAIIKPSSIFGQWLYRFLDLVIQVRLDIKPVEPITFGNIENRVQASMAEDPESFEEFSGRDIVWWKDRLKDCSSAADLLKLYKTGFK